MANEKDQTRYPDSRGAQIFGTIIGWLVVGIICVGLIAAAIFTLFAAAVWLKVVWPVIAIICVVGLVVYVIRNRNVG